jgi:hypothetical protein
MAQGGRLTVSLMRTMVGHIGYQSIHPSENYVFQIVKENVLFVENSNSELANHVFAVYLSVSTTTHS